MIEIIKTEDGWYAEFNDELGHNLLNTIEITVQNANGLLDEANILYDKSKFARSAALAILAEEEYAKSILLKECIQAKTWNSFYYKILKQHAEKQATSEYVSFLLLKIKEILERNRFQMIPLPTGSYIFPGSPELEKFKTTLQKNTIKKKKRDIYKQSMFYSNIGKTGILTKSPQEISAKEAAICIDNTAKMKEFTKFIIEDLPLNELDKRFRQVTTVTTNHSTYWTICYKEGFDLSLDLFKFTFSSHEDAENKIDTFLHAIRAIKQYLEDKSRPKPIEELKICREFSTTHKFLDQIQSQKKELGLRYSLVEEIVELSGQ